MNRSEKIETILRAAFSPSYLSITDESHLHRGHAGAASGGGHFSATVVSEHFRGLSAVARQRAVYQALGSAMGGEIHALALKTLTPEEWERSRSDR